MADFSMLRDLLLQMSGSRFHLKLVIKGKHAFLPLQGVDRGKYPLDGGYLELIT